MCPDRGDGGHDESNALNGEKTIPTVIEKPNFDLDIPKDCIFTEDDYYDIYRVASHGLRLKIMRTLRESERLSASEISNIVNKEVNDLHYHLRQLKRTALIRNQRDPLSGTANPYSYYTLTTLGDIILTEGIADGVQKPAQERDTLDHYS